VRIFRIHGPFLFGATEKIDEIEHQLNDLPPVIIIRLRNMNALDGTGLMAMERIAKVVRASGRAVIFCGALPQPKQLMEQSRFAERVGAENVLPNITEALERARVVFPNTRQDLRVKWDARAATAQSV
jgi:SulP family sulfate permease